MSDSYDRLPPQSREAEAGIIGSMIRDNSIIPDMADVLEAGSFYFDANRTCWRSIIDIYSSGSPVDLVILSERLKADNQLENIGGVAYLIKALEDSPTAANSNYYAKIVREKWLARELIMVCNDFMRRAYDGDPIEDLVAEAQRQILSVDANSKSSVNTKLCDVISDAMMEIDRRNSRSALVGFPTGLIDLDEVTGGFHPGELCILAARPSVGKTALCGNICLRGAEHHGLKSLIISIEQSGVELGMRWLCGRALVNSHAIRKGKLSIEQAQRLVQAGTSLKPLPIWINESPHQKVRTILSAARRLQRAEGLGLIVVDYLQLIDPEQRRATVNDDVSMITRSLKLMARELKVPVLCLSQLSRASEKAGRRPRLSDLRDSGAIEQDADTVILLHRPNEKVNDDPTEIIEAIVEKQRNGPCGIIELLYSKKTMTFENKAIE